MCPPKVETPKAPPPPPPAPPRPSETAQSYKRTSAPADQRSTDSKRNGVDRLRVDLSVPSSGSGVQVPKG
jgi:hypothetical protein